jgi:hypothetical protein
MEPTQMTAPAFRNLSTMMAAIFLGLMLLAASLTPLHA